MKDFNHGVSADFVVVQVSVASSVSHPPLTLILPLRKEKKSSVEKRN